MLARRPTQVIRLEGPPGEEDDDCDPNKAGIPYSSTTGVTGRRDLLGTTPENGTPSTQEGVPRGSEVSIVSVPELGPKIVTPNKAGIPYRFILDKQKKNVVEVILILLKSRLFICVLFVFNHNS